MLPWLTRPRGIRLRRKRSLGEKNRITLRLEVSSDLPNVLGDRVQLQQVLLNLILNAVDAMVTVQDRVRELVIRTPNREDHKVQVTVRDSWGFRSADPSSKITLGDSG